MLLLDDKSTYRSHIPHDVRSKYIENVNHYLKLCCKGWDFQFKKVTEKQMLGCTRLSKNHGRRQTWGEQLLGTGLYKDRAAELQPWAVPGGYSTI